MSFCFNANAHNSLFKQWQTLFGWFYLQQMQPENGFSLSNFERSLYTHAAVFNIIAHQYTVRSKENRKKNELEQEKRTIDLSVSV